MKSVKNVEIDYDFDESDSALEEIASSLRFRNRHNRKSFRFYEDEQPVKRKRNHNRPRFEDTEQY